MRRWTADSAPVRRGTLFHKARLFCNLFKGALAFFLLDMGSFVASRFVELR